MTSRNPIENLGESLGEYLREQRTNARLSLRQLADLAGVSNPYLSQIERGIKKPSAEILQQLAKGLQISSETLYVKAGFLDERTVSEHRPWDVEAAIGADAALSDRQKATLIDIYRSFVGEPTVSHDTAARKTAEEQAAPADRPAAATRSTRRSPTRTTKNTTTRKPTTKTTTRSAQSARRQTTSSAQKTAARKNTR